MYEWISVPKYYNNHDNHNHSNYNKRTSTTFLKNLLPRPIFTTQNGVHSTGSPAKASKTYADSTTSSLNKQSIPLSNTKYINDINSNQLLKNLNAGVASFKADPHAKLIYKSSKNSQLKDYINDFDNGFDVSDLQKVIYEDDFVKTKSKKKKQSFYSSQGSEPDGTALVHSYETDELSNQFVSVEQKYFNSSNEAKHVVNSQNINNDNSGVIYYQNNLDEEKDGNLKDFR